MLRVQSLYKYRWTSNFFIKTKTYDIYYYLRRKKQRTFTFKTTKDNTIKNDEGENFLEGFYVLANENIDAKNYEAGITIILS